MLVLEREPIGLSREEIKKKLIGILGEERVMDDAQTLESYAADRSFAPQMKPLLVVKPENVKQVQEVVGLAKDAGIPLVPVSSGGPHYKGDTVPSVPEAVIVDLSGMNKILSINRQQRMAVVEPGVTYGELLDALAKEGLTISVPLAPRATKSVLASVLEVEPRLNSLHQWNYIDPLRCTEVVWGDGNRIFTGDAGGSPNDLEKQWSAQKWQMSGTGPMMLDFYRLLTGAQGSMGMVTWASLKCEINTTVHKMYLVPSEKYEKLTDFVYRVVRLRFSNELFLFNGANLAYLMGESPEQIALLQKELPPWVALVGIAGREILPEERVEQQEADIEEIAQQSGLRMLPSVPGVRGDQVLARVVNPSSEPYWKERYKGAFQEIFFVTTLEQTTQFIEKMYKLAQEAGYPVGDIGIYVQPLNMGTCYHCEFDLPYDPANRLETEKVKNLFTKASEEFARIGAYYSRPYGIWSRLQMNKDAQSASLLKQLKGVFDPSGIMNPGKLSI